MRTRVEGSTKSAGQPILNSGVKRRWPEGRGYRRYPSNPSLSSTLRSSSFGRHAIFTHNQNPVLRTLQNKYNIIKMEHLYYRQKLLLALLQVFGGQLSKLDLQKYLFLFTQEYQKEKTYEFVPYLFGCFSFQSYADRRYLIRNGYLKDSNNWHINKNEINYLENITHEDKTKLVRFNQLYKSKNRAELIRTVYLKYPYYAINSQIADKVLSAKEQENIKNTIAKNQKRCFFTIGYEGIKLENYLNKLIKNNIKLLCDIRRNPISRKYGFSKKTLADTLKKLKMEYLHIPELGIISEKRQNLKTSADYELLFNEYENTVLKEKKDYLDMLFRIFIDNKRIAITCFEADHNMCHRSRVAKALYNLSNWDYQIEHL
jgi:uncharacterized protein (DUF488 family)